MSTVVVTTPTPSTPSVPTVFALGGGGMTFEDAEALATTPYSAIPGTPTPSSASEQQQESVVTVTTTTAPGTVGEPTSTGQMPAGCACTGLAQAIYTRFLSFLQLQDVFDNPVTKRKGRISRAFDLIEQSAIGSILNDPSKRAPGTESPIQVLREQLQIQTDINQENILSLLSKTKPPSFITTNDKKLVQYIPKRVGDAPDELPKCQTRDWAIAMTEIAYLHGKVLAENANAIQGLLRGKLSETKTTCAARPTNVCQTPDALCEVKVKRFFQSNTCEIKPQFDDQTTKLMNEVDNLLLPTLQERERLFAWARDQFLTEYNAAKMREASGQSTMDPEETMCINGCSQFALELADIIWKMKSVSSPRLVQIPRTTPAEFAKLPVSVQRAYVYAQSAHEVDIRAVREFPCNIPLISSYIIYLWAAIDQLYHAK